MIQQNSALWNSVSYFRGFSFCTDSIKEVNIRYLPDYRVAWVEALVLKQKAAEIVAGWRNSSPQREGEGKTGSAVYCFQSLLASSNEDNRVQIDAQDDGLPPVWCGPDDV